MIRGRLVGFLLVMTFFLAACGGGDCAPGAIRMPRGAGGVGFLPLLVMEKEKLIETHAEEAGVPDLQVCWLELGGPTVMNEKLLSGAIDFSAAGPPAFLILWDKLTTEAEKVKGVAAMTSLPMYLNVRGDRLKKLEDFTDADKIAMTATGSSIPAIVIQMYAAEKYGLPQAKRFDKYTVQMTHPDGLGALLAGSGAIAAHFTSPPFHKREQKAPGIHTIMTTDDVMGGSSTFTMLWTTTTFYDRNPKAVAAVLAALEEATRMISKDKAAAAAALRSSTKETGLSEEELVEVIGDPAVKFTTTPENVMKYAEFMHRVGTLKNLPASWEDLFFPEIHGVPGN
jgi:NitT/TauT family transport system substrate-binding protein